MWEHFFEPRSVAVVGASRNEKKLGYLVVEKLVEAHFEGEIYPINPKLAGKTLLGRKAYARLTEVPGKIDLVVVVIPRDFVLPIIEDCGSKGARSVVIISAGFKEVGEEGAHLEDKILKVARKWGISIIGPNCLGIINAHWNL
ncbi:CoA-binding protein, partial [Candidatus Aerophobetes bacterium]|nr:CoA-binding protein [Candidatus Aerophobetes bacterium]